MGCKNDLYRHKIQGKQGKGYVPLSVSMLWKWNYVINNERILICTMLKT